MRLFASIAVVLAVLIIVQLCFRYEHVLTPAKKPSLASSAAQSPPLLADSGYLPDLDKIVTAENTSWLNSAPLSSQSLRGKVVLIDFWTYSCINSLRDLPYVQSWASKYKQAGLVVIGVHSPEFGFEKKLANVENAVRDLKVSYPVAIDSNYGIWQAFNNEYWPADYFIDGKGRIRHHHFGEGEYGESERVIQKLLEENGATGVSESIVSISAKGIEAPPSSEIQVARNLYRLSARRAVHVAWGTDSRLTNDVQPARETFFESNGD